MEEPETPHQQAQVKAVTAAQELITQDRFMVLAAVAVLVR
jgi:hypothetical protein